MARWKWILAFLGGLLVGLVLWLMADLGVFQSVEDLVSPPAKPPSAAASTAISVTRR